MAYKCDWCGRQYEGEGRTLVTDVNSSNKRFYLCSEKCKHEVLNVENSDGSKKNVERTGMCSIILMAFIMVGSLIAYLI